LLHRIASEPVTLRHNLQLQPKASVLTRLIALLTTVTLAAAMLFRSPSEYRMTVCIIVSVATTTLAVSSLINGKPVWALPFLAVLGVFTPFQLSRFSHQLVSVFDMATLALFAASPLMLRKSTLTLVSSTPQGRL